jgi:flagellar hook-length control protein FliK
LAKQASLRQAAAERTAADETGEETGSPEALALAGSAAAPALRQAVAAPRQAGDGENPADPALPGEAGADPGAAAQAAGSSTMPSALPSAMPAAGSGRENAPRGVNEKPAQDRKKAAPGDRASLRDLAAIRDPEGFSEQTGKAGDAADGPRGSAETRTRDKRRDRAALEVRDLRTGDAGEGQHAPGPAAGEGPGREIGLSVDLSAAGEARDAPALDEAPQAAGLPDRLGRELREHLRDDIVRNASIVLRDGGEGTIRLALKPESLGNVKIRLEMTENKIAGKITVESEEAFRAFERELRAMERAFRDSGFDGATLEMAVSADGGRGSPGRQGEEGPVPYFSSRFRQGAAYDIVLEPGEGLQALDGSPAGRVRLNMLV